MKLQPHYNHYELVLEDFPGTKGRIPLSLLARVEHVFAGLAGGVLRLLLEGNSHRPGKAPAWLRAATELELTGKKAGETSLRLEAPQLRSLPLLHGKQLDLFTPEMAADESAYGLLIAALREATKQGPQPTAPDPRAARLLDRGLLHRMGELEQLLPTDEATIRLHNQRADSRVALSRETLGLLKATEDDIPPPRQVAFVGTLEILNNASKLVRVRTENRLVKVSTRHHAFDAATLGTLYTREVAVQGMGNFNALRQLVGVEATYIGPALQEGPTLLRQLPQPIGRRLDVRALREKQGFRGTDLATMLRLAEEMAVPESADELRRQLRELRAQ